jgi:Fanconi anemia group M protein
MSGFLNIFSKKPIKIVEKPRIIADYREKNSLVISNLINLGIETDIRELKVADYIVRDVAIERKTISDFLSSMINKRLLRQLEELQQYKKRLLIIEGIEEQELYNDRPEGINGNAVRGFILSILLKFQVPIIFTKNPEDTAKFICILAKKQEKEISLKAKKKNLSKKEQMRFILEGFQGIGPATARKLLKEFKTLKGIFNASYEELKSCIGKKAEVFKVINEKY